MQFTTLFTATLALAMGVVAADINPRLATLRIYGEPGCSALNEGEIGVFKDMQNKCQTFLASDNVRSINLESLYGVGCKRRFPRPSWHRAVKLT